jgi:hypothetical protein
MELRDILRGKRKDSQDRFQKAKADRKLFSGPNSSRDRFSFHFDLSSFSKVRRSSPS